MDIDDRLCYYICYICYICYYSGGGGRLLEEGWRGRLELADVSFYI